MKPTRASRLTKPGSGLRAGCFGNKIRLACLAMLAACIGGAGTKAEELDSFGSSSSTDIPLEELINIKVTSVSKREQKLSDAAAAISVLSNEDLRRSGAATIADALRLVPGLEVAAVNASQWAISARGFNNVYANKLLVLVDKRAVYTPLFGGVHWDLQQMMLEDVDRIEVIRGPGATLWGANAVNGVINIVSRSAKETQGGLIYGGGGDVLQALGGARYGGQAGEHTYYRVFGGYSLHDSFPLPNGQPAGDGWQGGQGGFRLDHYPQEGTQLTWQADGTFSDLDRHTSSAYNFNTIGRWTREISEQSTLEAQVYFDRTYRDETPRVQATTDTSDVGFQHTFGLGGQNDVIWGVGYRFIDNHIEQTNPMALVRNGDFGLQLFNAFLQDQLTLIPDKLILTAGTKLEHNDYTGFEVQPGLRLAYKPTEHQTLWGAVSRAVRTPAEAEGRKDLFSLQIGAPIVGPSGSLFVPTLVSHGDLKSEVLWAYEAGYRIQPAESVTVEVAGFYNKYSRLVTFGSVSGFIPGAPVGVAELPFGNLSSGRTYGGEISISIAPASAWRITAAYSLLEEDLETPQAASALAVVSPQHQAILRSSHDFTKHVSVHPQLRYVSEIQSVSAYLTADILLSCRLTDQLELAIVGQNLLDNQHPEQAFVPFAMTAEAPRGVYGKLTWHF